MAGYQFDPDWGGRRPAFVDESDFVEPHPYEVMNEWDDSRGSAGGIDASGSWPVAEAGGMRARMRHARRRPPRALRATVVVLACVAIAGLLSTTIYRLQGGRKPSAPHGTTQHIPPVITLFSPTGDTQAQGPGSAGTAAPLPPTNTAAPSQYLAPDQASGYELSLIAASGAPDKAIVVSRFSQTIHVYESGQFIAGSYAITGRPELPTPVGVYQIFLKVAPAVLYSPWPPGSPYYYAPAPVNYTMEFRAGGFLIHDAPWHHVWGPGMNDWHYDSGAKEWQWGTHGCVTAPTPFIQWLYNWGPDGTTVIIY